jgi:hypothetical protein
MRSLSRYGDFAAVLREVVFLHSDPAHPVPAESITAPPVSAF